MPLKIWAAVRVPTLAMFCFFMSCSGSDRPPNEQLGEVNEATTGVPPDPAGSPGAGCNRFVEQLPNGNVRFAVKFPQPQLYVEVFVKQNGVQNTAQNIVTSGVLNSDGTYSYSLVKPSSQFHAGDAIDARFYSYRPGRPGVFTPGLGETVWLPTLTYGQVSCTPQPSACHDYVKTLANGDLRFSVTLPDLQQYVEVFIKQNGVQNIAQNIVGSRVSNGNGTSTFSLTRPATQYHQGDLILTRFYSYKAGQPGVFTPGPQETVWSSQFVVGSVCQQPAGGPCAGNSGCQSALTCVVGTCRDCSVGGCSGSPCSSNTECVSGLVCSSGECRALCSAHPTSTGCVPQQCANNVKDGGETDVDCGGPCPDCGIGEGCSADSDCETGMACGTNNGACFRNSRSQRSCWPVQCQDGVMPDECGQENSPCGKNCSCVRPCVSGDPASTCPAGEVCKPGLGPLFGSSSPDVCAAEVCPSNDPALCGGQADLCGKCLCTPNCTAATCQSPGDGCNGQCSNVCADGQTGCTLDLHCPSGSACLLGPDGVNVCRPAECAFRKLEPPLCGTSGAPCGAQCPTCTPECGGRQCGADPKCGTSCGTCSTGAFCDALGQCASSTNVDPPILVPDGAGGEEELQELPPAATSSAGALNGFFSVSDQGTSEYNIPIAVPPGRAGMEPVLSLRYSGTRINADVGVGWRVEGLSSITRCPRVYALDGYSAPIRNDGRDLFCIDGKRLEAVAGPYGGNGTQYRTLIESFAKIESFREDPGFQHDPLPGITPVGRDQQGPDYFRVWTKDGRIVTYGKSRDSLVFGRDGVRNTWLVNRVEDRSGNTIIYTYENALTSLPELLADRPASLVRPIAIAYTGHGEQAGDREVRFEYEARPDQQLKFRQGGVAAATFSRLKRITTRIKGAAVNNLRLEYGSGSLSQISRIYECVNGDDTNCKRPTKFDYVQESGFSSYQDGYGLDAGGQLDANGDGIPDFFETTVKVDGVPADPALTAAAIGSDLAIGVASGFVTGGAGLAISVVWSIVKGPFWGEFAKEPRVEFKDHMFLGNTSRFEGATSVTNIQGLPCNGDAPTFFLDYDQDGKDDVVRKCKPGQLYVGRSTGNGQFERYPTPEPVVHYIESGIIISALTPGGSAWDPGPEVVLYDVNGDSLQDVVTCKDQYQLEVRLRLGPTLGFAELPITKVYPPATQEQLQTRDGQRGQTFCGETRPTHTILDVDGDGAPELLVHDRTGWKALRYEVTNGVSVIDWAPVEFPDVGYSFVGTGLNVTDLNGDGLADVAMTDRNHSTLWINTGAGRFLTRTLDHPTPILDTGPNWRLAKSASADYDADGSVDFVENWTSTQQLGTSRNFVVRPSSLLNSLTAQQAADLTFSLDGHVTPYPFRNVSDLDGDGNEDLFGYGEVVFYGSGVNNSLLKRIEDGVGNLTVVSYDGADTYTSNCSENHYPEACLRRMRGLVALAQDGLVDANGVEVLERTSRYQYYNGRVNVAGHGWLGFERRTVADSTAGRVTRTDYLPPQRYDLNGLPTEAKTAPYLYPLAGLARLVTVDDIQTGAAGALPATLDTGNFGRRLQWTHSWLVGKSDQNRLFPRLSTRVRAEYARLVADNPFEPPLPFETNGVRRSSCNDRFTHDVYGNVTYLTESCNVATEQAVDEKITDTHFEIDSNQWLISNPSSVAVTSTVILGDHYAHQVREVELKYDSQGLLKSVTRDPNGSWHKTSYIRNGFGNVELATETVQSGESSRSTTLFYDVEQYSINSVTNAKGHTTQLRVDQRWGKPTVAVDPNGVAMVASYDGFGHLAETHGPDGITIYTRENLPLLPVDTVTGQIHPRLRIRTNRQGVFGTPGGSSAQDFDYRGRLVRTETVGFEGSLVVGERTYDAMGRARGATLPHEVGAAVVPSVAYSYDYLDRVVRVEHADGSHMEKLYGNVATLSAAYSPLVSDLPCWHDVEYCASDVEISIDQAGKREAIVRDAFGRIVRSVDGENIATPASTSDYGYGPFGQLETTTQNGAQGPRFGYDAYGRMVSFVDPDVGEFVQSYNGYDELRTRRDRLGHLRTFSYDPIGRIEAIVDEAGTTRWFYDEGPGGIGQVSETLSPSTSESPGGQRVRYRYEPATPELNRGLLKRMEYRIDGQDYAVEVGYDDLSRPHEITYPNVGGGTPIVARYTYDEASEMLTRLEEVGSGTIKSIWRLDSAFQGHLVEEETFGNGAVSIYGYDPDRRWVTGIHTTLGAVPIQGIDYAYYPNGQVLERAELEASHEYTYDALLRLSGVSVTRPGIGTIETGYGYDALGNLEQRGGEAIVYSATQPHLVNSVGGSTFYSYDANGNVATRVGAQVPGGQQVFDYTPFDLPRAVTTGSGPVSKITRFDYTADEQRVVRRDFDKTRHFVADVYERVLSSGGATIEERFRLHAGARTIGEIVRSAAGDQTLYHHQDHLGSVDTLSDNTGASFQQDFDAWGAPLDVATTRDGFTGHQHDADLGLIDMNGRVYDTRAARFTTPDPVLQSPYSSQGLNRYAYVLNDPVNMVDPSGFYPQQDVAIGIGVAYGNPVTGGALASAFAAVGNSGLDVALGSVGVGVAGGGLNVITTALSPPGASKPGRTATLPAPSGAPRYNAGGGQTPKNAVGESGGGVGPSPASRAAGPKRSGPDPYLCATGLYECDWESGTMRLKTPTIYIPLPDGAALAQVGEAVAAALQAAWARLWPTPVAARAGAALSQTEVVGLRNLFGTSTEGVQALLGRLRAGEAIALPQGVTVRTLQTYRGIAENAIRLGKDTLGVQAARKEAIELLLKAGSP